MPGETTKLYEEAKKLMQKKVEAEGKSYNYKLKTQNPQMVGWANETGDSLFDWIDTRRSDLAGHIFRARIKPDNNVEKADS